MFTWRTGSRDLVLIPQVSSHARVAAFRSSYGSPATPRSRISARCIAMFKKAVRDAGPGPAKPLQSSLSRSNGGNISTQPPAPSVGVKRKLEMANIGKSALGSLHSAVYFDENDFDDDLNLDLEEPVPLLGSTRHDLVDLTQTPPEKSDASRGVRRSSGSSGQKSQSAANSIATDITYPELPPVRAEDVHPQSSIPVEWSSSPPSHLLPPSKTRPLPWMNETPAQEPRKFVTPARPRTTMLWNQSTSAVKNEQKEMRKQNKKSQQRDSRILAPRARVPPVFLSDEQRAVLEAVVEKSKSIFFTGSAGTGKSVLMREIIKKLREKYRREPDRVAVTASTGLAACNIEGVTLHSFAGIGLGKEAVPELVRKVRELPCPVIPCG